MRRIGFSPNPSKGPGVSGWKGPPGPNLRAHKASTASRMSEKCGGQNPSIESRGVRVRPAFVCVEAESNARHGWIAARAQDTEWIHAIEHPAAKSHRVQHQHAGVATRREFGRDLGQRPLLNKSQRPSLFNVHNVLELFDARDRAIILTT